jgi:hypothetical protein
VIGVAVNPTGNKINEELDQQAQYGDTLGVNLSKAEKKIPKIVSLTNPDDLRITAQKVAKEIYGGDLGEADLRRFIASYQQMEQTAGDQENALYLGEAGGTMVGKPTSDAAAEMQIRREHPDQVAVTAFGARMNDIISTFSTSAPGMS